MKGETIKNVTSLKDLGSYLSGDKGMQEDDKMREGETLKASGAIEMHNVRVD